MNRLLTRRGMLALAPAVSLYGWQTGQPLPRTVELTAGSMTMIFEPQLGFLRYLRYGDAEAVRGIYAAVRDQNWGTVAPRISRLRVQTGDGGFQLNFDVECKEGPIDFFWQGEISGDSANRVQFRMEGEARSLFLRNRIGFCVLHPVKECAGRPCTVRHSGVLIEKGRFPREVAPNQPFKDIVAISHEVAPGVIAEVKFEGETFEMEDHRNWTDASYKTYCTPLEKPFPVEMKRGARISQSVTVTLSGGSRTFSIGRKELTLEVTPGQVRALPKIGIGYSPGTSEREQRRLIALNPAHVRVDTPFDEAPRLPLPLEIAVHLGRNPEAELKALAQHLTKTRVARYLVFHKDEKSTSPKWVKLAREYLRGAPVGAGADAYFAELNRARPDPAGLDFLCFSANPQVHAFDNASLVENLAAQADAVQSARQFAGGKGIIITPVTLKPRFNPNATGGGPPAPLPADPRQTSLFGAAWTLGSIKYVSESGAQSVTYYQAVDARGVMTSSGKVYPLYHVLADVGEMAGGEVMLSQSSQPLAMDGMVIRKGVKICALLANMTAEPQAVRLVWPSTHQRLALRKLDEHTLRSATESPENWRTQPANTLGLESGTVELSLAPYAVARIDSVEA
ncbi:MAG TPA: hypothetical protein VM120_20810 [Bryobacteraceae bacterium]|nr:hypothetical protein [Bryobacteraceae bacterium]